MKGWPNGGSLTCAEKWHEAGILVMIDKNMRNNDYGKHQDYYSYFFKDSIKST
jgi:hypothetical protein